MQSSQALEQEANTDPDLIDCIVDYVQGQGTITMALAVQNAPPQFPALGHLQDIIGWRQFLEGMISKEIVDLQQQFYAVNSSHMSLDKWSTGLITRLLEITHGQWLYQNFMVHNLVSRAIALQKSRSCYWR